MNCYIQYNESGVPTSFTRADYILLEKDGLRRVSEEELAALEAVTMKEASAYAEH